MRAKRFAAFPPSLSCFLAVCRNLRAGRFLLLIVGDGIREEMERLAEFLQSTPQLRFTLALVELQLYRLGKDGGLLVMPVVVGRTSEVVRAVVHVASTENAQVDVSLELANESNEEASPRRRVLSYDEFFQELANSGASPLGIEVARRFHDNFSADRRFQIDWMVSSFSIKLRDPVESSQLYSILVVERVGRVYIGWLNGQLRRAGLARALFFAGWCRSAKGNLWKRFGDEGPTITIFRRPQGGFGYCIYTDAPTFSQTAYETEREAQVAVWDWLERQRER